MHLPRYSTSSGGGRHRFWSWEKEKDGVFLTSTGSSQFPFKYGLLKGDGNWIRIPTSSRARRAGLIILRGARVPFRTSHSSRWQLPNAWKTVGSWYHAWRRSCYLWCRLEKNRNGLCCSACAESQNVNHQKHRGRTSLTPRADV